VTEAGNSCLDHRKYPGGRSRPEACCGEGKWLERDLGFVVVMMVVMVMMDGSKRRCSGGENPEQQYCKNELLHSQNVARSVVQDPAETSRHQE